MSNTRAIFLAFLFGCASAKPSVPLTAEAAASHVGEQATVEFTVVHVGHSRDGGSTFLDSKRFERGDTSFSAFIPAKAKAAFESALGGDIEAAFAGKTLRITGEIKDWKGKPEMVLSSPDQVAVVPAAH